MPSVVPGPVVEQHATSWGGLAHVLSTFVPTSGPIPAVAMPTANPAAPATAVHAGSAPAAPEPAQVARPVAAAARFTLGNAAARYGIFAGQTIDLSVLFPGAGLPQGSLAEVLVNPKDPSAIGLKNLTAFDWVATTAAGAQVSVLKGRNLKLADGEKIVVGSAEIIVQAV
jgi:hypothetical protein